MTDEKPHHGRIDNWTAEPCDRGLGFLVVGTFLDHPYFKGEQGHTSFVVKHDGNEIETRNSRYTLVSPLPQSQSE